MATAYVLNIGGDFGLAIELIRKISEPESKSIPHITIRYVDVLSDNNLNDYDNKKVSKIEIIKPGTFGVESDLDQSNRTVFLECEAEELEELVHKPHFPDSVFHITLYDGSSTSYAKKLYELVRTIEWNFELHFNDEAYLSKIEIKKKKKKKFSPDGNDYSDELSSLFHSLTGKTLSYELLISLNDDERLFFIELVVEYINVLIKPFPKLQQEMYQTEIGMFENEHSGGKSLMTNDVLSWLKPKVTQQIKNDAFFLTPPELASDITKVALSYLECDEVTFGDPSIGTGVFFASLLKNLNGKKLSSAIGIEVEPERANNTLRKWHKKGLQVTNGDYLHLEDLPKRNLIIANPPYIRFQDLKQSYAKDLNERASVILNDKVSGFSGLFVYFLILSHKWMEKNAIAAWLIPSSFMETDYGQAIRKYLTTHVTLLRLHKFDLDKAQFENAMVSSTVVILKNKTPSSDDIVEYSFGGSLLNPNNTSELPMASLGPDLNWNTPFHVEEKNINMLILNDLFDIKRGIATGANDYFIMEASKATELNLPRECLKYIIPRANSITSNIIEAGVNGEPVIQKLSVVFDCSIDEQKLIKKYPQLVDYFENAEILGLKERTLIKSRKLWYKQEQRDPAPFLCTYMGRGSHNKNPIRFLRNNSKAIATNAFIMMYPREPLKSFMDNSEENREKVFKLLLDIENSTISKGFRTYAGGLKKIEPKSLKRVSIDAPPAWLQEIVDIGTLQ